MAERKPRQTTLAKDIVRKNRLRRDKGMLIETLSKSQDLPRHKKPKYFTKQLNLGVW